MLRHILLINSSGGIVLFSKEFTKTNTKPGMLAGLVTAMLRRASERIGLPASYIELANVSVSICSNPTSNVTCALFYDGKDGKEFGALISGEILHAFCSMFASPHEEKISTNMDFSSFNIKISEIIRNAVKPVLETLQQQRGIERTLITTGDTITYSTQEVDKYGVLANIQAIMSGAAEIMGSKRDQAKHLMFKGQRTTIVVKRVDRSNFITVTKNTVKQDLWMSHITKASELLHRVLMTASNLQDSTIT